MNLMFYDFNGSTASANNTTNNFYKPNESEASGTNGDRVPTREKGGYQSASMGYRRRG